MHTRREPLRGSDADGAHAGISLVLARYPHAASNTAPNPNMWRNS